MVDECCDGCCRSAHTWHRKCRQAATTSAPSKGPSASPHRRQRIQDPPAFQAKGAATRSGSGRRPERTWCSLSGRRPLPRSRQTSGSKPLPLVEKLLALPSEAVNRKSLAEKRAAPPLSQPSLAAGLVPGVIEQVLGRTHTSHCC